MTALAIIHRDEIIERIASGETATDIAKSLGLKSHSAISNQLKDDKDYLEARAAFHVARLDNVEGEIREANDPMTLARVRELATMYRWRAERECRDIYGKLEGNQSVTLNLNLSALGMQRASSLLDSKPVPVIADAIEQQDTEGEGVHTILETDPPV